MSDDKFLMETIRELKKDVRILDEKVDKLLQFKWQIIGGSLVASVFVTCIIQVLSALMHK